MRELDRPCELLAALLDYPGAEIVALAERCRSALEGEAAARLGAFVALAAEMGPTALEELYVRTFDFEPSRCLELGYQLFGENDKRAAFLIKAQAAAKEHGVDHPGKLADHLSVLLRVLGRLPSTEARLLADEAILPAVDKLLGAFDESPYRRVLEAVKLKLCVDFAIVESADSLVPLRLAGEGWGWGEGSMP